MELMTWVFEKEVGDVLFEHVGRRYRMKEVKALQAEDTRGGLDGCHEISDERGG